MKRKLLLIPILAVMAAAGIAGPVSEASPVDAETVKVTVQGKSFQVKTVRVDLADPTLQLEPVTAAEGIGYDEPFASMLDRKDAVAAVNGTFFNAYEQDFSVRYPNGLLLGSGRPLHSGENQALIVEADKTPAFRQVSLGVRVTFKQGGMTSTYFPWGINKYYGDGENDQVVWYTPDMGRDIAYTGTKIVIRENKVTAITQESVPVPGDGFVFFVGNSENNRKNLLPRVRVGDLVEVITIAKDSVSGETVDPGHWLSAIGAGPKLVTGGAVDVDFKRDGFDDLKITAQKARRSFVGVDSAGRLVMGTVDGVTVQEEAEIAQALGLTDAMNLDGGASSALFANGEMLTAPGRRLSNALVVRRLAEPLVQIEVNGRFVPDFQGFIRNDTTLVPIRPFLAAMGADFTWDGEARTLAVRKGGISLGMMPDRNSVEVNGRTLDLAMAPTIVDGHIYLPLRFIVETWGGNVEWDGRLYRVSVELDG